MSSLTKVQLRDRLKNRSVVINSLADAIIEEFIDQALEVYSERWPEVRWQIDNIVVDGQELYTYPTSAMKITKLRESDTLAEILFQTEDQDGTNKIRPGNYMRRSYHDLLQKEYYIDPLSVGTAELTGAGYTSFDVEYVMLQTMTTIKDRGLAALALYVEYLAYNYKASDAENYAVSITDADSSGASTTISQGNIGKFYSDQAQGKLNAFNSSVRQPYGTRG